MPEGCKVHNNDSVTNTRDRQQVAVNNSCENGRSARTCCSALTNNVGLPNEYAMLLAIRDETAVNLA